MTTMSDRATQPKTNDGSSKGLVVLLHGILRSKTDMLALDFALKKQGYETANILYPSRKRSLEDLTDFVAGKIESHRAPAPDIPLHFVTHSMGGLIARYYIARFKPDNLGKVVMLSPPNTGSDLADALLARKHLARLYRSLFGPAAPQLATTHTHEDGRITYPLGIIAGTRNINPLAPFFIPRSKVGPHDGIVPVARTPLEGMTDHITLPVTHTFMMFNPAVIRQVLTFLEQGKFQRAHAAPEKISTTSG